MGGGGDFRLLVPVLVSFKGELCVASITMFGGRAVAALSAWIWSLLSFSGGCAPRVVGGLLGGVSLASG